MAQLVVWIVSTYFIQHQDPKISAVESKRQDDPWPVSQANLQVPGSLRDPASKDKGESN